MGDMGQETKLIRKNWWENYGKWQPQPVMQYTEYARLHLIYAIVIPYK